MEAARSSRAYRRQKGAGVGHAVRSSGLWIASRLRRGHGFSAVDRYRLKDENRRLNELQWL